MNPRIVDVESENGTAKLTDWEALRGDVTLRERFTPAGIDRVSEVVFSFLRLPELDTLNISDVVKDGDERWTISGSAVNGDRLDVRCRLQ